MNCFFNSQQLDFKNEELEKKNKDNVEPQTTSVLKINTAVFFFCVFFFFLTLPASYYEEAKRGAADSKI